MSDRLRKLLDEAVAEVRPRRPDPVADVLRRTQIRRRPTATTAALVLALTLVGVTAAAALVPVTGGPGAVGRTTGPSMTPSESPSAIVSNLPTHSPPPTPHADPGQPQVVDGRAILNGVSFAVPAGWSVRNLPETDDCLPPRTLILGWSPTHDGRCEWDRIISMEWNPSWGMFTIPEIPTPATYAFALPGGQPAWVGTGVHGSPDPFGTRPGLRTVEILVPWSNVSIELNVGYEDLMAFMPSLQASPRVPTQLALHEDAVSAYFVPPTSKPSVNPLFLSAPNISAGVEQLPAMHVLQRLKNLTEVVPPGQECPTLAMPAAAIYLFPSDGATTGNDLVVITDSYPCSQATSIYGGRVWVPQGLIDELRTMFTTPVTPGG